MNMLIDITIFQNLVYIVSSVLFILGIKMLGKESTAVRGNILSSVAMLSAVSVTLIDVDIGITIIISAIILGALIGSVIALKVKMTAIPEMVALFNGFGGMASFLIAWSQFTDTQPALLQNLLIMITIYIGGITFSGSIVAYGKLSEKINLEKGSLVTNILVTFFYLSIPALLIMMFAPASSIDSNFIFFGFLVLTVLAGLGFVMPIGGGDMPVVISLLNSLSGIAAAFAGLLLLNNVLIVAGSLVGASGLILTIIMAKAMNRTIGNILFVGYASASSSKSEGEQGEVKPITAEDAYLILENASSVLVVPGYGMAVAQAQHVVRELGELLEENGTEVKYGIHPVAGRLPGHMNVLLAEAKVPYDIVLEMDEINQDFPETDVVIVIGSNDIVNPAAQDDPNSPIAGMPVLEVWKSRDVIISKRGKGTGYSGIENPLFYKENSRMLYGDAKKSVDELLTKIS